jgi:hypothetical protein
MRTADNEAFRRTSVVSVLALALAAAVTNADAGVTDEPAWNSIRQEIGNSKPGLPSQCQGGMYEVLGKLDSIRDQHPDFFSRYDYGPVHKEGATTGHYGVAIYPKRESGQTYEQALKGGVVMDYTNYWSDWTGQYRTRGWDEWRWYGKFGKGRLYDDTKAFRDSYWNADGPVYPQTAPPSGNVLGPGGYPPNFLAGVSIRFVQSLDPNDKTGAVGVGPDHAIPLSEPLGYLVMFENLPEASAPAKNVVVSDPLDSATMDLSTLVLGDIVVGDLVIEMPEAAQSFADRVDLRPDKDLLLEVWVDLDPATSVLTWTFLSIDPATGRRPANPFNGFLPPNTSPPSGEGHVGFTVSPLTGLANGTAIRNRATIVFDVNDPIETPEWTNVIDTEAPTSAVDFVTASACSQSVEVAWSANDSGAGVRHTSVYVSEDGSPPVEWMPAGDVTTGSFLGAFGRNYAFHSIAADLAGNIEAAPAIPDAALTLDDCGPHDLAITRISVPAKVKIKGAAAPKPKLVKVQVQNRGPFATTIADLATLGNLVGLRVESTGGCAAPAVSLRPGKPQKSFPLVLQPLKKVNAVFDVLFSCVNDAAQSTKKDPGHGDYGLIATLDHSAIGGLDEHAADDACPRSVTPPGEIDPYPDGSITDRGCGARKSDGTLGDPVVVDLFVKP